MAKVSVEILRNRYRGDYGSAIETAFHPGMQTVPEGCSGILYDSPEAVSDCFEMTRNAYAKDLCVPFRITKISFEKGCTRHTVDEYIKIIKNLYGDRFQVFTSMSEMNGNYTVFSIINTVSYVDGNLLRDNNESLKALMSAFQALGECELSVGENVLFDSRDLRRAYEVLI